MSERSLLMVDDEENILSSLSRLFRREGYQLYRATSGADGLELLSQHRISVVISDQRMPEMTGVEFLSKVKQLYPETVRIVLSGYTDLNSVTDAINEGAVYKFLTKPWDDDLLRENVREAFRNFELRNENDRLSMELREANKRLLEYNQFLKGRMAEDSNTTAQNIDSIYMAQKIIDTFSEGVLGVAGDGKLLIVNRAAQEILKERTDLAPGASVDEVLPGALLELLEVRATNGGDERELHVDGVTIRVFRSRLGEPPGSEGSALIFKVVAETPQA